MIHPHSNKYMTCSALDALDTLELLGKHAGSNPLGTCVMHDHMTHDSNHPPCTRLSGPRLSVDLTPFAPSDSDVDPSGCTYPFAQYKPSDLAHHFSFDSHERPSCAFCIVQVLSLFVLIQAQV